MMTLLKTYFRGGVL